MSSGQKIVLAISLLVAIVMGVFPPWQQTHHFKIAQYSEDTESPGGYAFIGSPPQPEPSPFLKDHSDYPILGAGVQLDVRRLAVQYTVLLVVSVILLFLTRGPSKELLKARAEELEKFEKMTGHLPFIYIWWTYFRIRWPSWLAVIAYSCFVCHLTHHPLLFPLEFAVCLAVGAAISFLVYSFPNHSDRAATVAFCIFVALATAVRWGLASGQWDWRHPFEITDAPAATNPFPSVMIIGRWQLVKGNEEVEKGQMRIILECYADGSMVETHKAMVKGMELKSWEYDQLVGRWSYKQGVFLRQIDKFNSSAFPPGVTRFELLALDSDKMVQRQIQEDGVPHSNLVQYEYKPMP